LYAINKTAFSVWKIQKLFLYKQFMDFLFVNMSVENTQKIQQ